MPDAAQRTFTGQPVEPVEPRTFTGIERFMPRKMRQRVYRAALTDVAKAVGQLPVLPSVRGPGTVVPLDGLARAITHGAVENWGDTPEAIQQALAEQGLDLGPPFGPGRPLNPFQGYGAQPRGFDYPVGINIQTRPRWNRMSFDIIRGIIDAYDVAQICIGHLINDVRSLDYQLQPMDGVEGNVDDDLAMARAFLKKPDGTWKNDDPGTMKREGGTFFRSWLAKWLNDLLRYDAAPLYRQRDEKGDVIALKVVDGTTVAPLIDYYGYGPTPAAPGFLQWIQGLPWTWLTTDDLIYAPMYPMSSSVYGLAPIEKVILNSNTDIRFQWYFLQFFTEGTVPEGLMHAPPDQSDPAKITEWQEVWDAFLLGDERMKHRIRWVPHGADFTPTKSEDFNENFPMYLMRRTVAAYGVTPNDLGFTESVNRATGDTQVDVQFRVGTSPILGVAEDVLDSVLQDDLGLKVQGRFDDGQEKEDRLIEAQAHQVYVSIGAESPDEVRRDVLGLDVDPEHPVARFVLARTGPVPLKSIIEIAGEIDSKTGAPEDVEQVELPPGLTPKPTSALHNPGETDQVEAQLRAQQGAPGAGTPGQVGQPAPADSGVAPAVGAVGAPASKAALIDQATIGYEPVAANPDTPCSDCAYFQAPSSCADVAGVISPAGWCPLWTPGDRRVAQLMASGIDSATSVAWVKEADTLIDELEKLSEGIGADTGLVGVDQVKVETETIDVPSVVLSDDSDPAVARMLRNWRQNSQTRLTKGHAPRWFVGLDPAVAIPVWRRLQHARTPQAIDNAFEKAAGERRGKGAARRSRRATTTT